MKAIGTVGVIHRARDQLGRLIKPLLYALETNVGFVIGINYQKKSIRLKKLVLDWTDDVTLKLMGRIAWKLAF